VISRPQIPYTYDDYKTLTASTDQRYELIDGDLYMNPSPTVTHQVISKNLALLLDRHVSAARCGIVLYAPLDVVLGEGEERSVVQPDIFFVSNERAAIVTDDEIVGAPDLVVEILSPRTAKRDVGIKKALYARSGVREYWIVDPQLESIEVVSLGRTGHERSVRYELTDRLVSAVASGFEVPVADVFAGQPAKS
jgi:Uma2 family endonuclease